MYVNVAVHTLIQEAWQTLGICIYAHILPVYVNHRESETERKRERESRERERQMGVRVGAGDNARKMHTCVHV